MIHSSCLFTSFLITSWRCIMMVVTLGTTGPSSLYSQFTVNTFSQSRIMFPLWTLCPIYPIKIKLAEHSWEIWEVPYWSLTEGERAGISNRTQTPSQTSDWAPQKRLKLNVRRMLLCSISCSLFELLPSFISTVPTPNTFLLNNTPSMGIFSPKPQYALFDNKSP